MENHKEEALHRSALIASVLCMSIYDGLNTAEAMGARSYFFWLIINVLAATAISGMLKRCFFRKALPVLFLLKVLLICSLAGTVLKAMKLWERFYPGAAVWMLLFFILLLIWRPTTHSLNSTGWILCGGVILTVLLVVGGVYSQLRWEHLSFQLERVASGVWTLRFRPEYLGFLLMHKQEEECVDFTLPVVDAIVRFLLVFLSELVFGSVLALKLEYGELLRAWEMGIFSRSDSLVLTVWLMLVMYRILLLEFLLRQIKRNDKREERECSAQYSNKMDFGSSCRYNDCGNDAGI